MQTFGISHAANTCNWAIKMRSAERSSLVLTGRGRRNTKALWTSALFHRGICWINTWKFSLTQQKHDKKSPQGSSLVSSTGIGWCSNICRCWIVWPRPWCNTKYLPRRVHLAIGPSDYMCLWPASKLITAIQCYCQSVYNRPSSTELLSSRLSCTPENLFTVTGHNLYTAMSMSSNQVSNTLQGNSMYYNQAAFWNTQWVRSTSAKSKGWAEPNSLNLGIPCVKCVSLV